MFTKHPAPDLPKRRREFLEQAGKSFDQMFGVDGKNGLVRLCRKLRRFVGMLLTSFRETA
jgi:hypothetical protein